MIVGSWSSVRSNSKSRWTWIDGRTHPVPSLARDIYLYRYATKMEMIRHAREHAWPAGLACIGQRFASVGSCQASKHYSCMHGRLYMHGHQTAGGTATAWLWMHHHIHIQVYTPTSRLLPDRYYSINYHKMSRHRFNLDDAVSSILFFHAKTLYFSAPYLAGFFIVNNTHPPAGFEK